MLSVFTDRLANRLQQLLTEVQNACDSGLDYHDRLREFKNFCDATPALAELLQQLPRATYDFDVDWRGIPYQWPGGRESYAMRWDAVQQMVDGGPQKVDSAWLQLSFDPQTSQHDGLRNVTNIFVSPLYHFLLNKLESTSAILYALLRYKRWAEWFEADSLRKTYQDSGSNGEGVLDESLRRFLFESGVDYPFSQPASPRGRVDVVARLETLDPLVLEIKVWDSQKQYKENRVRDGLRQVMDYSSKYGKDRGHVVVFNLDEKPLSFVSATNKSEWPARLEYGGKSYFFIDVHIAERLKPISQQDKGKPVEVKKIYLNRLLKSA